MITECVFCKIVTKDLPAEIVYEDDGALGFLDLRPIAPGHVLVIPRRHVSNIRSLPENEIGPVFVAVKRIAQALAKTFTPDGFSYGINEGITTGQAVEHLHIHIVPRFNGDGGKSFHSIVQNYPKEDLKTIAKKIGQIKI